jgi:hypothetical protein
MKSHKTTGINIFLLYIFGLMIEGLDPGGPKTYGSATLHFLGKISTHYLRSVNSKQCLKYELLHNS